MYVLRFASTQTEEFCLVVGCSIRNRDIGDSLDKSLGKPNEFLMYSLFLRVEVKFGSLCVIGDLNPVFYMSGPPAIWKALGDRSSFGSMFRSCPVLYRKRYVPA